MVLAQNRQISQKNKTEDPEISPHICGHLILCKDSKSPHWEKTAYSSNSAYQIGWLHVVESR